MSRMKTDHVLETCLYVDNLDAAHEFYTRVLGLEAIHQEENRHIFYKCSHGMFLIFNADVTGQEDQEVPPHGAVGIQHVAFAMKEGNVESWREHLKKENVAIERELTWPNQGHSIYFRDPANNSIELATGRIWGLPDLP